METQISDYHSSSNNQLDKDAESVFPNTPLISEKAKPQKRRWYIVIIFSLFSFVQACVWNTWGPVAQSAFKVFSQWDNSTIALLSNWGCITFVVFFIPVTWLTQFKGLRFTMVCNCLLMFIGTGIRCITVDGHLCNVCIHIGQFLNGIAGIIVCTAPLLVSAAWFPSNERTTSTAISTLANIFGGSCAFVLGPFVVKDSREFNVTTGQEVEEYNHIIEQNLIKLMNIEFYAALAVVLCILVYFPSNPSRPPSITATVKRYSLKNSLSIIIRHKHLLMITLAFALTMFVFGAWTSIMNLSLESLNIPQIKAGWIGFTMKLTGCVVALIIARFSDIFRKRYKCFLLVGLTVYAGLTVVFALLIVRLITVTEAYIFAIIVILGSVNQSMGPLFCELASELAYPINENIVGALLAGTGNAFGMIFLFIFFIPNIGITWLNWCLIASTVISIPLVALAKETYNRSVIDDQTDSNRQMNV